MYGRYAVSIERVKLHFVLQISVQDQTNGSKSTISTNRSISTTFTTLFCTSTVQYSEYTNPIHTIVGYGSIHQCGACLYSLCMSNVHDQQHTNPINLG